MVLQGLVTSGDCDWQVQREKEVRRLVLAGGQGRGRACSGRCVGGKRRPGSEPARGPRPCRQGSSPGFFQQAFLIPAGERGYACAWKRHSRRSTQSGSGPFGADASRSDCTVLIRLWFPKGHRSRFALASKAIGNGSRTGAPGDTCGHSA